MKRKSILALNLTTILLVSISLFGCGKVSRNNDTARQNRFTSDGIRGGYVVDGTDNDANNAQIRNDGTGIDGSIRDNATGSNNNNTNVSDATRYGAANFKNDITNAGYKLKETADTKKDYFKGNETDYLLGGDVVRLYEYNSPAELESDINRIAPNGMTINGTNAKYDTRPYYYRKGNTLIVYEGKEPAYVDEFGRLYGNTLRP